MADSVGSPAAPAGTRVVHTYHGHVFHSYYGAAKTRLFIAIERALARFCADRIVAISDRQRDEICRSFKVGRFEQFTVIPLGIDFDEIDSLEGGCEERSGSAPMTFWSASSGDYARSRITRC